MADNTQVTAGTGDVIRGKDRAGVKTQIVGIDLGIGSGTESLLNGSLPVDIDGAASGLALEATVGRRFGGSKLAYAALLTSTTDITPTTGKAIRLLWLSFVPSGDNTSANLVTVGFVGSDALYTGYAMAHWERFDGSLGTALRVTLDNAQPVAVTVHYEEFTP